MPGAWQWYGLYLVPFLFFLKIKLNVLKFTYCLTNLLDLLLVYKKIKKYFIQLSK